MDSPHDNLFHFVFRHPPHAAAWAKSVLPPLLGDAIDWATLQPANARAVGPRLRSHFADLVFAARLCASDLGVVVLCEHKSHVDPALGAQVLRYAVHFRRVLGRRRGHEPLVLPLVLHHGDEPFDAAATDLAATLRQLDPLVARAFGALQPHPVFLVDDLTQCSEAQLRRPNLTPMAQLCLLALRILPNASADDALAAIERWRDLLAAVDGDPGPPHPDDALEAFECYVLEVTDVPDEQLRMALTKNLNLYQGDRMTTAQKLRQEGRAEGKAEGRTEGHANALLRLLTKRFGPLPAEVTERLMAATLPELDAWTDRILDAKALADVFAR